MINVTKSYLPPLPEYIEYLNKIWDTHWLTNNGQLVQELEKKLIDYLDVKHLLFLNNGTIAIQLALKALNLRGKIITTPFSYVATTTAILWENCEPIFVDIDSSTCCIDATKIEEAITPETSAILATHVYGIPCNVEAINIIAEKYNLKVIYDGAHAFGVKYKDQSLLNFGDVSTLSFHATKLFHTVEGGAVITKDIELCKQMSLYRSFGHVYEKHHSMGINGKNSEFHAAMGLCNLPKVIGFIQNRKVICEYYDKHLDFTDKIQRPIIEKNIEYNYAYYPIIFSTEKLLLKTINELKAHDINPRRYFYPSLNKLPYLKDYVCCPISECYAKTVLCLPLYDSLELNDVDKICQIINRTI